MAITEKCRWLRDSEGTWLCFLTSQREADSTCSSMVPGKKYEVTVKEYRKKRSLDANAFCWELCTKLAERIQGHTKEDVYREAIRQIGIYKDFSGLSPDDAKTLRTAWEMLGTGWITEQVDYMPDGENVVIRCYYGSSTYNTKQMSRLIDHLIQDCKSLGIETRQPEEVESILKQWDGKKCEKKS